MTTYFNQELWNLPDNPLMGFIEIPAGPFLMGSDPEKDQDAYDDEFPCHTVDLPRYWIARWPVTVAQWKAFVESIGSDDHDHQINSPDDHPVANVSWYDAMAYCDWLNNKLINYADAQCRCHEQTTDTFLAWRSENTMLNELLETNLKATLPSEAEWEKAARGPDGRIYPWGNDYHKGACNDRNSKLDEICRVGQFPSCASPYGVEDMAGNVWEWTRSCFGSYDYQRQINDKSTVLRGGAFLSSPRHVRCAVRSRGDPGPWLSPRGFRVVVAPSSLNDGVSEQ